MLEQNKKKLERPRKNATYVLHSTRLVAHLHVTEQLVVVGGDDHVNRLDGTGERLVHLLRGEVELKQGAVNLPSARKKT